MRLRAGICARRRTYFLLRRQKKVGKEKATPLAVSLRFAAGNLRCSVVRRCCGTHFAASQRRSDNRSKLEHEAEGMLRCPQPAPRPALLGTARGEGKSTRAIASLGLGLDSLSLWERVGVRVVQFKNDSCLRLSSKR